MDRWEAVMFNECSFSSTASTKDNYMYINHCNLQHQLWTELFSNSNHDTEAVTLLPYPGSCQSSGTLESPGSL